METVKSKGLCIGMPILVNHKLGCEPGCYYWHIVDKVNKTGTKVKTYGYYKGQKHWEEPFYWDISDFILRIWDGDYFWEPNTGFPPIGYYLN